MPSRKGFGIEGAMHPRSATFVMCLCVPLLAGVAQAAAIDVELIAGAIVGKGKPALVLTLNRPVANIELSLIGEPGPNVRQSTGPLKAFAKKRFDFDIPMGTVSFAGQLEVTYPDKTTATMPLKFAVELSPPFEIKTSKAELNLAEAELHFTMTRAAGRCEHEILVENQPLITGVTNFSGQAAGTPLLLTWKKHGEDDLVLKIRLICWDATGAFYTDPPTELLPWSLEIPHEEVNFASGKWDILNTEQPKVDRALQEITTAARRYGQLLDVQLYVIGYTDTVSDNASNLTLSINRARAIAEYFRKKGVRIAIFYTGFGEERLAVPTPDNTDEIQNRRVRYIIGQEQPEPAVWKKL